MCESRKKLFPQFFFISNDIKNLHFPRPFFHHSRTFSRTLCHQTTGEKLRSGTRFPYHRIFPKMKNARLVLPKSSRIWQSFSSFGNAKRRNEETHKRVLSAIQWSHEITFPLFLPDFCFYFFFGLFCAEKTQKNKTELESRKSVFLSTAPAFV